MSNSMCPVCGQVLAILATPEPAGDLQGELLALADKWDALCAELQPERDRLFQCAYELRCALAAKYPSAPSASSTTMNTRHIVRAGRLAWKDGKAYLVDPRPDAKSDIEVPLMQIEVEHNPGWYAVVLERNPTYGGPDFGVNLPAPEPHASEPSAAQGEPGEWMGAWICKECGRVDLGGRVTTPDGRGGFYHKHGKTWGECYGEYVPYERRRPALAPDALREALVGIKRWALTVPPNVGWVNVLVKMVDAALAPRVETSGDGGLPKPAETTP